MLEQFDRNVAAHRNIIGDAHIEMKLADNRFCSDIHRRGRSRPRMRKPPSCNPSTAPYTAIIDLFFPTAPSSECAHDSRPIVLISAPL